jgi:hypothetical protein
VMKPAWCPSRKAAACATSSEVLKRLAAHVVRTCSNHWARGPGQLLEGQRRDDDAGADGVDAGATSAPGGSGGQHAQRVGPLGERVGVHRGSDLAGLRERQCEQL